MRTHVLFSDLHTHVPMHIHVHTNTCKTFLKINLKLFYITEPN